MKKPSVNTNPVANKYSMPGERIIEVSFGDGSGCLISLRNIGAKTVEIYRADDSITVYHKKGK